MEKKSSLCGLIFKILVKAMSGVGKYDSDVENDLKSLPERFKVQMGVFPHENYVQFEVRDGRVYKTKNQECDLVIVFKNVKMAKQVLLGKVSIAEAFTKHAMVLKGNINLALVLVRVMERTEDYLFPKWYTKVINRQPKKVHSAKIYLWLVFGRNKYKESKNVE